MFQPFPELQGNQIQLAQFRGWLIACHGIHVFKLNVTHMLRSHYTIHTHFTSIIICLHSPTMLTWDVPTAFRVGAGSDRL